MRPIVLSGALLVLSAAFNLTIGKYGSNVPDWLIIACWLVPLIPLMYLGITHQKLLRQRQRYKDMLRRRTVPVILSTLFAVLIIIVSVGGAGYRAWAVLTQKSVEPRQAVIATNQLSSQIPPQTSQSPNPVAPTPNVPGRPKIVKPKPTPPSIETGKIDQGPCSNLQIGGQNNQASTNCGLPPPKVLWEVVDRPPKQDAKHPEVWIKIQVDGMFENAKFAVICDRNCKSVGATMTGPTTEPSWGSIPDRPEVAAFMVVAPNPMTSDVVLFGCVESEDDSPVKILEVRWLKVGN